MFGDGSGTLVIKARLGSDIRRIPIHNEELTFDDLVLMMLRVFAGRLSREDDLLIKYTDEDGDLVTIQDNGDLSHAKQYGRVLRLTLFVNGRAPGGVLPAGRLRAELQHLSTSVNSLMTKLAQLATEAVPEAADNTSDDDRRPTSRERPSSSGTGTQDTYTMEQPSAQQQEQQPPPPQQQDRKPATAVMTGFDPLGEGGTYRALAAASAPPPTTAAGTTTAQPVAQYQAGYSQPQPVPQQQPVDYSQYAATYTQPQQPQQPVPQQYAAQYAQQQQQQQGYYQQGGSY